jgi:hypothetical protein
MMFKLTYLDLIILDLLMIIALLLMPFCIIFKAFDDLWLKMHGRALFQPSWRP